MRLEADHLIVFAIVAKTGSLSDAAKQLFKSQPAISAQLKRLQEAVGEPLYSRHRYGIKLTKTGEDLLPFAQNLLRSLEGARQYSQELKVGHTGHLSIAASTTIAMYFLPKLLKSFGEKNKGLELKLLTSNTREAVQLLKDGSADLAMIEGPTDTKGFELKTISHDEIILVMLPEHPLATRKKIKLTDLDALPVVRRESGSGTRAVVDDVLAKHNVQMETVLEAKGVDAIKEAVLQGFAAGFISRLAVKREVDMGLLIAKPIDVKGFERALRMLHPPLDLCSQTTRRFVNFIKPI